jgi:two-component system response regulator PilR (NtrC family)
VLAHIAANHGNTPVAVITAYGSTDNAVSALKAGAFDYISKPIQLKQLREVITSALNLPQPVSDRGRRSGVEKNSGDSAVAGNAGLSGSAAAGANSQGAGVPRLLGESAPIQRAREMIAKLARSQAPVYIAGESGTGKEVAARLIHSGSARRDAAFVAVNCGAIPENLMESEFFGYRKGAFTGADADKEGFLHAAVGGTLFLDEVGDLPLAMQVKLLRVIQEKKVRKLGDTIEVAVDFRIISATHKNLAEKVAAGEFRQDLFYRLNVICIVMPPLRERIGDLPAICAALLARIARDAGVSPPPTLTAEALEHLMRYGFPGNVRELENLLHRALALSGNTVIAQGDLGLPESAFAETTGGALDETPALARTPPEPPAHAPLPSDLAAYLDLVERDILERALEQHRFNRTAAGASLGLSLRQMRYRMARLGVFANDPFGERE